MAEAYQLSNAVEHGLRTRAAIVDMRGQLNIRHRLPQQWDMSGLQTESLFAHVVSPNTKQVDNKRLVIDLSALKQLIWDNRDDCDEEVDGSKGDYFRCIDTSAMLSDYLTKTMTSCRLIETGIFDMTSTEESLAIKSQEQDVERIEERARTVASL